MILGNDTLGVKVCIGDVALESVPLAVLCNLLFADDDFYVLADFKKLVVATLVHLTLRDASGLIGFSQSDNSAVTVVGILLCTLVGITDDKSFPILTFVVVTGFTTFSKERIHCFTLALSLLMRAPSM